MTKQYGVNVGERSSIVISRYGNTLIQFTKFGLVGGSGIIVNMVALVIANKLFGWGFDVTPHDTVLNLLGTRFHLRWYHIFATIAFVVANTWNFQINRWWTFKSHGHGRWLREFLAFFAVGLLSWVVSQIVMTLLMNPTSPLELSPRIFDSSTGVRNQLYWANLIGIFVAMPVNFVVNKLWTFKAVRVSRVPDKYELLTEKQLRDRELSRKG